MWKNGFAEEEEKEEEKEEVTNALVPNASYDVATHTSSPRGRRQKSNNHIYTFCHQHSAAHNQDIIEMVDTQEGVIFNHIETVC